MWSILNWINTPAAPTPTPEPTPTPAVDAWRSGLQASVAAYERVLIELQASKRFQARRAAAELGFGPEFAALLRARLDCAESGRRADVAAVFALLCTNTGRFFLRHDTPQHRRFARTIYNKLVQLQPQLPLDVELRQLMPSAPPLAACAGVPFFERFVELPLRQA